MGADYEGQDMAIAELSALSPAAKEFLQHHICNPLCAIAGAARLGRVDLIQPQVDHIVDDLIRAGIRVKSYRR